MTTSTVPSVAFARARKEINWAGLIMGQIGVAACFEGDPGTAKTASIEALALATGRLFFSYELSRTQPEDLQGFPVVDELKFGKQTYKFMRFVPDERLLHGDLEPSIILLDEVTNVGPSKQAPALNLVQRGLKNAWMYMACNPPATAADGHPLTCPFINRIWKGEWQPDHEAHDYGLRNQYRYPSPDIPIVPANYLDYQAKWGALATDFLRLNPAERNNCPTKKIEQQHPWPSMRSWENVTRGLAAADAVGASEHVRDQIVEGLIGIRVAAAFKNHIISLKLPKPEEIFDRCETYKFPGRYDVLVAIITSLVNYMRYIPDTNLFDKAMKLFYTLHKQNPEMAALFAAGIRLAYPEQAKKRDAQKLLAC